MKKSLAQYVSEAHQSLTVFMQARAKESPAAGRGVERIRNFLADAQLFELPLNGELVDDPDGRCIGDIQSQRLPYPVCLVGFETDRTPPSEGLKGVQLFTNPMRMALALDLMDQRVRSWFEGLPYSSTCDGVAPHEQPLVCVWPLDEVPLELRGDGLRWAPSAFGVVFYRDAAASKVSVTDMGTSQFAIPNPGQPGRRSLTAVDVGFVYSSKEFATLFEKLHGDRLGVVQTNDCALEASAVIQMLSTLACKNVTVKPVWATRREIEAHPRGRPPLKPYYRILIDGLDVDEDEPSSDEGKVGKALRTHRRRGHLRRLQNETIFIRATIVNPGAGDLVPSTYTLRPRSKE